MFNNSKLRMRLWINLKTNQKLYLRLLLSLFFEARGGRVAALNELDVVKEVLNEMWFSGNLMSKFMKGRILKSTTELFINT